ncbi:MAG: gamma-glutamyltransferase family protein [Rhodospirillales bacterium]|jgi:gamma-glutamyltranspeptidase/glutathione hydrolase|nr:gamma-glutamyltransferase family protein [Rhodospirillales bacterium]
MSGFTTRPEILGTFGVVASTHWLASATGMAILEAGGNAFDAAVATGFALQVVEPHLCGPAGETPILLSAAGSDAVKVICGQGTAPAAATIAAYRDQGLDLVLGSGLLAAVVPGAFDAWMVLLRDYGTLRLADVLEPAIGFAQSGYPVVPNISNTIAEVHELFRDEWPTSAAVYLKGGAVPAPGSIFSNPDLAATYRRIVDEAKGGDRVAEIEAARRVWSQGFIAEAIDRFCRETEAMDVSGERHRGLLSGADMADWQATYEDPQTYDYHGFTVCKTGPWGQGPVCLQQLALLKGFDLDGMNAEDPAFVHVVTECAKLAFADREAFYGDPDFVTVPTDTLLGDPYNDARRKLVGDEASMEIRPGEIAGHGGKVVVREKGTTETLGALGAGEPTVKRFDESEVRGDTVHFDIIDRHGNMVSATPSGGWLQSSPVVEGLGFCLTSRAQMFWLEEGLPASLEPGKRPRTTLTPSLALRDGEPYMVFGTPGGDQQDQWCLHLFLRHVHFGMNLQESIDAPGFQTEHFPGSFYPRECDLGHLALEGRFPAATAKDLEGRGHRVHLDEDWSLGRMTAAAKDGPLLKAGANPRFMQGYAVGR